MSAGIDSFAFRQLLGRFPTGVTVLTARGADGRPVGMTANSFTSVSLVPPLVLVCIDHDAGFHRELTQCDTFAVNVLAQDQEAVSRRFANPHEDRFDGVGYATSPRGNLLLDGCLAHLECVPRARHEAGDHTIVVAEVVAGEARDGRPLCYFRGGYAALA